jgi:hypothetical protein
MEERDGMKWKGSFIFQLIPTYYRTIQTMTANSLSFHSFYTSLHSSIQK